MKNKTQTTASKSADSLNANKEIVIPQSDSRITIDCSLDDILEIWQDSEMQDESTLVSIERVHLQEFINALQKQLP